MANVVWKDEIKTKPQLPLITMIVRNVQSSHFSAAEYVGEELIHYYPSTLLLEINTHVPPSNDRHNDALPDLSEFEAYLQSDEITDELFMNDITAIPSGPITNVTQILDQDHEFRAMAEYNINFNQVRSGSYGIKRADAESRYDFKNGVWAISTGGAYEWSPTTSGGGPSEMVQESISNIEKIEFTE